MLVRVMHHPAKQKQQRPHSQLQTIQEAAVGGVPLRGHGVRAAEQSAIRIGRAATGGWRVGFEEINSRIRRPVGSPAQVVGSAHDLGEV
jgi:hypothetical protein